jgi:hypothetical protein
MEKSRKKYPVQVVDLAASWPLYLPAGGYEWVEGVQVYTPGYFRRGRFLTQRRAAPGETAKEIAIPEELYLEFYNLTAEGVLDFANRYGALRFFPGEHFHRASDMRPALGEPLEDWLLEIAAFRAVLDLWNQAQNGTPRSIRQQIEAVRNRAPQPRLAYPPAGLADPAAHARAIVIQTINRHLAWNLHAPVPCHLSRCKGESRPWEDATEAQLEGGRGGTPPDLVVISTNLIKTLWMQLASVVAERRKLKRCEASDCGKYMDVTHSQHPKARRMHKTCAERLRKRRYLKKKKLRERKGEKR